MPCINCIEKSKDSAQDFGGEWLYGGFLGTCWNLGLWWNYINDELVHKPQGFWTDFTNFHRDEAIRIRHRILVTNGKYQFVSSIEQSKHQGQFCSDETKSNLCATHTSAVIVRECRSTANGFYEKPLGVHRKQTLLGMLCPARIISGRWYAV